MFGTMNQIVSSFDTLIPLIIFPVILIIFVTVLLRLRRQIEREPNLVKRGLKLLKLNLTLLAIFTGIDCMAIFVLIGPLNSFYYPRALEDVQTTEQVLGYLQQYNRAIATTAYALFWFLCTFAIWFLTSLYAFAQVISDALLSPRIE